MKRQGYSGYFEALVVVLLLVLPFCSRAQFTFTTNNGAITITGFTGSGGNVTIPSTINGYPVRTIGAIAFYNLPTLTGVIIPDSVISIADEAFDNCVNLKNLAIGNGVTSIGDSAFAACYSLTNLTIPNSVTNIGGNSFFSCSALTNILIGNSVTSIGGYAFHDCASLTSVTIPNSVQDIGVHAFDHCSSLTNMLIGNSVTSIGDSAFIGCSGLRAATVPDNVTSVGPSAFAYCLGLKSVTIGNSVTNIGGEALYACEGLTNIAVNATNPMYISVGGVLFNKTLSTLIQYPGGLGGSYAIPDNVTSIGDDAFNYCVGLTSMTIPNSLTTIGAQAFISCAGLKSVVIPNSVLSIGNDAFLYCGLTNVTIGNSVTNIGNYAFLYCWSLHQVYFLGNVPRVNGGAGSTNNTVFYGESGTAYYVSGTTGWENTFGGWPTAGWYQPEPQILGSDYDLGVQSNTFQFTISWATNAAVVVEASTNLQDWTPIITNSLVNGTNAFRDSDWINYPQRFYRIRSH
jgi:hypothetical protein